MKTRRREIGKSPHPAAQMKLVSTPDGDIAASCTVCEGYALITDEEAATGTGRCFGEFVLIAWDEHAKGGFTK